MFISVAVNIPTISGVFDYSVPPALEKDIHPGALVVVPFGKQVVQGIVVEQDENDLIRFDFTSKPSDMRIFAAAFKNGFAADSIRIKVDSTITGAGATPLWLLQPGGLVQ